MKKLLMVSSLACLLLLSGCVRESVNGDTKVFTFAAWASLGALVVCLTAISIGWFLRHRSSTWSWGLLVLAPLALLTVVPGLFLDELVVDKDEFRLHTGFWFLPTERQVRFDDLNLVQITKKETRGSRGRKNVSYDFVCHMKNGETQKVPIGTLMEEGAKDILQQMNNHEVPIQNLTGE